MAAHHGEHWLVRLVRRRRRRSKEEEDEEEQEQQQQQQVQVHGRRCTCARRSPQRDLSERYSCIERDARRDEAKRVFERERLRPRGPWACIREMGAEAEAAWICI